MLSGERCTKRLQPLLLASAVTIVSWPSVLLAQGAADTVVETRGGGLDDIVVTARKREESVQNIPVSVTAISATQIDRRDLTSIEKIAASTPQLQVGRLASGSAAQITLRGIGSSATSISIEQSVAVVADGVYYGQGRIINEGFFDLARVEVLKGPQALFFGKNATAGVINITTADPTSEFELKARAGYEFRAQQLQGELIASGPLSDTFGLRAALRYSKMDGGYYKTLSDPVSYPTFDVATGNVTPHTGLPTAADSPGEKELVGRFTAKWDPTEEFTATLKASTTFSDVKNPAWNNVPYRCPEGIAHADPARMRPCSTSTFATYLNDMPTDIAAETPFGGNDGLYNRYRSWGVTGTVNYNLDHVGFAWVTNYNFNRNKWGCACGFGENGIWATENSDYRSFSSEFRALTTYDGPINLMSGIYFQKDKRNFRQNVLFAGVEDSSAPPGFRYVAYNKDSGSNGETMAAYGQLMWKFLPRFELTTGVRYTHETKDSFFVQPYVNTLLTGLFRQNVVTSGNQSFTNWSPETTISYKPTRDVNLYAAYKTAYKSGGFSISGIDSALSLTPAEDFLFDPEKAKGFEVGVKTTLMDNQLRLNFGLFRYKYSNLQVDFFNSPIFAFQTINAGAAVTKGFESDFEFAPRAVEGLILRGSLNYTNARYRNFLGPCYTGQTIAQGCTLIGNSGAPFQDLSGKPTAVAPEWTGTAGFSYDSSLGNDLTFGFSADARYSGSYVASSFGQPMSRVNDYVVLDASARIRTIDERWELALIGKNLTNKLYITGAFDGPATGSGTGTAAGFPADQLGLGNVPRTVQIQATFRY